MNVHYCGYKVKKVAINNPAASRQNFVRALNLMSGIETYGFI